jgi:hypothetical protein
MMDDKRKEKGAGEGLREKMTEMRDRQTKDEGRWTKKDDNLRRLVLTGERHKVLRTNIL